MFLSKNNKKMDENKKVEFLFALPANTIHQGQLLIYGYDCRICGEKAVRDPLYYNGEVLCRPCGLRLVAEFSQSRHLLLAELFPRDLVFCIDQFLTNLCFGGPLRPPRNLPLEVFRAQVRRRCSPLPEQETRVKINLLQFEWLEVYQNAEKAIRKKFCLRLLKCIGVVWHDGQIARLLFYGQYETTRKRHYVLLRTERKVYSQESYYDKGRETFCSAELKMNWRKFFISAVRRRWTTDRDNDFKELQKFLAGKEEILPTPAEWERGLEAYEYNYRRVDGSSNEGLFLSRQEAERILALQ
jgi:hypothetical protein